MEESETIASTTHTHTRAHTYTRHHQLPNKIRSSVKPTISPAMPRARDVFIARRLARPVLVLLARITVWPGVAVMALVVRALGRHAAGRARPADLTDARAVHTRAPASSTPIVSTMTD